MLLLNLLEQHKYILHIEFVQHKIELIKQG